MPSRGTTLTHLLVRRSVGSKLLNRSPLEDSSRRFISGISNPSQIFVVGDSEDHEAKQRKGFGAFHRQCFPKRLLHGEGPSDKRSDNFFESADDFERRLFGSLDDGPNVDSFYRKLDKLEKAHGRFNTDSKMNDGGSSRIIDGLGEGFNTLSDKMDEKLKKAARNFVHSDEIDNEDYSFRPDVTFKPGTTYTPRDLDLTKPGIQKSFNRPGFETTTKEVLKKADFRASSDILLTREYKITPINPSFSHTPLNVRFLANFLTEAGIIIKRSQTKISAKAQRKVAREIKTARAFGLMPFTTMGTKHFVFGKNMKDMDEDYMYDDYSRGTPGATAEPFDES